MRIAFPALNPDFIVELWHESTLEFGLQFENSNFEPARDKSLSGIVDARYDFHDTLAGIQRELGKTHLQIRIIGNEERQVPVQCSDTSHTLACHLAASDSSKKYENYSNEPLYIFSAELDNKKDIISVGNPGECNIDLSEKHCSIFRKYELARKYEAEALFLHDSDAKHLNKHRIPVENLESWNRNTSNGLQVVGVTCGQYKDLLKELGLSYSNNVQDENTQEYFETKLPPVNKHISNNPRKNNDLRDSIKMFQMFGTLVSVIAIIFTAFFLFEYIERNEYINMRHIITGRYPAVNILSVLLFITALECFNVLFFELKETLLLKKVGVKIKNDFIKSSYKLYIFSLFIKFLFIILGCIYYYQNYDGYPGNMKPLADLILIYSFSYIVPVLMLVKPSRRYIQGYIDNPNASSLCANIAETLYPR